MYTQSTNNHSTNNQIHVYYLHNSFDWSHFFKTKFMYKLQDIKLANHCQTKNLICITITRCWLGVFKLLSSLTHYKLTLVQGRPKSRAFRFFH